MVNESPRVPWPVPIDADDLATTLRVLDSMSELDETDPDFVAVRRATARMFKEVKRVRRRLDGMIDLISDNAAYAPENPRPDRASAAARHRPRRLFL